MKNIAKIVVLFCLIACMLLSTVSCNVSFTPLETTIDSEATDATTPEVTTPEVTTPEVTTPEVTTPDEPTIPVDPNEGKATYLIKVTDTNGNPLPGVKLQLYHNGLSVRLSETKANGYVSSALITARNYTVRVVRADGYEFDPNFDYFFLPNDNVAYIALAPEAVETPPEDETEDEIVMPEKIDMEGYVYKAYVRDLAGDYTDQVLYGNNAYKCIDFWVDEANSEEDVISYAVYNRNQQIENDYNCKIRQTASNGDQLAFLVSALQNGEGYDLTIIEAARGAQAATQGLLRNLNDTTHMDLSNPAFDQNSINELSVKDKLYFLSGDMNISTMEVAGVTVVNMDFYEDLADSIVSDLFDGDSTYANIYEIVKNKKWRMDTLLTIATKANVDIDKTDGALHVLPHGYNKGEIVENKYRGGDIVGYHQYLYSTLWYFYGSGGRITAKNEEGLPTFIIDQDKGQTLYDYIFDKFNRMINAPWIPHESSAILNLNFLTGDVLFADMSLFNVRTEIYPKAEFEYGILPIPVYEEGMDYQSLVHFNNWAHLWAMPQMVENQEYAERMMEIMAAYSALEDSTMDAYYERTIYLMASKDNGSREVMDIIKDSLVYDMALLYPSWGGIEYKFYQIPNVNESEFTDIVSSKVNTELSIQATIDLLLNPNGE